MDDAESLCHTKWECKYHVIFIPKYRRKALYGELRRYLGEVFRRLAEQKESRVEEGHLMMDHAHMMISIPPKYSVSQVVGYIKGKSAIHLARKYWREEAQLYRTEFLGAGVLRINGRARRDDDPRVHQAAVEEIDGALVDFGFRIGPISLLDEMGIEVSEKAGRILHQTFGERMTVPAALTKLVASGRLGRKNGKGFYLYQDGKRNGVDPAVYDRLSGGRVRQRVDRREIAERVVLQMVNEAARCLGEGILRSVRDGDVGAVYGLGFPAFRGGPFRWADSIGPVALLEKIERWRDRFGARFEPAPLLLEQGKSGKRFY